jgi:enterochelin esterase-like enzyme
VRRFPVHAGLIVVGISVRKLIPFAAFLLIGGCRAGPISSEPTRTIAEPVCEVAGTTQAVPVAARVEISLYLPPCYDPQTKNPYPVLYLLPGFGGSDHDWFDAGADRAADASIRAGDVPPFLIAATPDTFNDPDSRIVFGTILPYLESHYPVAGDRRYRAAAGGSYGGAAAYHLAFRHPELFSSAGIFGNGAALGEEESIGAWLAAIPEKNRPRVFINVGQSDSYMLGRARVLLPLLEANGISHVDIFSPGGHTYAYWAGNFPAYFRFLAQGWE